MKWRSQTNFLPLVLDVFSQSMKVDNYLCSKTKETADPWEWWQRNKMIARQTGLIRRRCSTASAIPPCCRACSRWTVSPGPIFAA